MAEQMWYYAIGGQQQGPVPLSSLEGLLRSGRIDRDTLVWTSGMAGWKRAAEVPELQVRPMEPPPPPSYRDNGGFSGEVVYAGFWRRYLALCIDQMLLCLVAVAVVLLLIWHGPFSKDSTLEVIGLTVGLYVGYWLYFACMESSPLQATLGKLAVGIRVTDLQGNRLSFWRAGGRQLAKILSDSAFSIGYLMAGFTARKQALHDMVAGALVVVKR